MNQSANMQDAEIAFEVEFYREIAKDRIIESYFDGTLNMLKVDKRVRTRIVTLKGLAGPRTVSSG